MKKLEMYDQVEDQEVKQKLVECGVVKALPVEINYELFKIVADHVPKKYKFRRSFIETAIINQLKADGVVK